MRFKRQTNDQSRPRHPGHPTPQQATEEEEEKRRKKNGSREKKKQPEREKPIFDQVE